MKRTSLLLQLLLLGATAKPLQAQWLAQDPFVYQFLSSRANDYSWQLNNMLFREDPATPMLTRSFTGSLLYNYVIANNMPELEYGNGKAFAGSRPFLLNSNRHIYSIAGSDLSFMNGANISTRLNKTSHHPQYLKLMVSHRTSRQMSDDNSDGYLDRPLENNFNTAIAHEARPGENTRLVTSAAGFLEQRAQGGTSITTHLPPGSLDTEHSSHWYGLRTLVKNTSLPRDQELSLDAQASFFRQESTTGLYRYNLQNPKFTAVAGWASKEKWEFITLGAKAIFNKEILNEIIDSASFDRSSVTAGGYGEMQIRFSDRISLELRHKSVYNTLYNWNHAPAARLAYTQLKKLKVFAYGMMDGQVTHPLASGVQYVTGTRQVEWDGNAFDRYARAGLHMNEYMINNFRLLASYNYTHYFKRNITDVYTQANKLRLYSVDNSSRDHTIEAAVHSSRIFRHLYANLLYRYDDVKARIDGVWRQLPFYPEHSFMLDLSFAHNYSYQGYRFPYVQTSALLSAGIYEPGGSQGETVRAPALFTLHAKAFVPFAIVNVGRSESESKKWLKWFKLTIGCDNITNVKRQGIITKDPGNPASYEGPRAGSPLSGRRFYFGLALTPQPKESY